MILHNGSRVHIVGGGPGGSFLAIHLIRQARQAGKRLSVVIIDKKMVDPPGRAACGLKACNFCAGVISPALYNQMAAAHLRLPEDVVCQDFSHIWIHGLWKNFPLKVPSGQRLVSIFRGMLPQGRGTLPYGLDAFLLSCAVKEGAEQMAGMAREVRYNPSGRPVLRIEQAGGETSELESDFVCIAAGVNAGVGDNMTADPLFASYARLNPSFRPPKTRPALIFELKPGRAYLKKYMNRELYLIIAGNRHLHLEHGALVPKGDYLTVSLVGKSIDTLSSSDEAGRVIRQFMSLPHVRSILPGLTPEKWPVCCMCLPRMATGLSQSPFADRIALAGDAFGARLYRDGLYSAFTQSCALAAAAVNQGVDKETLTRSLADMTRWLETDNRYCRTVFMIVQKMLKSEILSRMLYQSFASEMKFRQQKVWPLGKILWQIGSGLADYQQVFKNLHSRPVLFSLFTGVYKTIRNMLTEWFFGLKWGDTGRYPTVVLREKRDYIKQSIQAPLGIRLAASPQMERMYAIKIRASADAIFRELGKFGEASSRFLRLRFVDVKRTKGQPNRKGSVVRYALRLFPISMDICLIRAIENRSLLYEPQELFTKNGVLLFDIAPTKDGNNRLVIYTAFDFKTGRTIHGRLFFKALRRLFPDYAHDVVWNHAVCTIKALSESAAASVDQKQGLVRQAVHHG